jgi:hypothetical protein
MLSYYKMLKINDYMENNLILEWSLKLHTLIKVKKYFIDDMGEDIIKLTPYDKDGKKAVSAYFNLKYVNKEEFIFKYIEALFLLYLYLNIIFHSVADGKPVKPGFKIYLDHDGLVKYQFNRKESKLTIDTYNDFYLSSQDVIGEAIYDTYTYYETALYEKLTVDETFKSDDSKDNDRKVIWN